jgi:hypothetical protein
MVKILHVSLNPDVELQKKMVNSFQRNICWFEQWHLEVVTSNLPFIVLFVSSFARNSCWQFLFYFSLASHSSPRHHGCHTVVRIRELWELHMWWWWWLKVRELRMAFQLSCFLPFLFFMFFSFSFSSLCFILSFSSSFFCF